MGNYWNIFRKVTREFCQLTRYYGVVYATYNLIWWLNFYIVTPCRFRCSKWALLKLTQRLICHVERNYSDIIEKYDSTQNIVESPVKEPTIWVFWGQGEDDMPLLIKSCYEQIKGNNPDVRLVTKVNVKSFIDIPEDISQKVCSGQITWAHFSDIVRMSLLTKYGGLWLDATCWVPKTIPFDSLSKFRIYSPNSKVCNESQSICFWTSFEYNWSGWCLWASHTNVKLFRFVSEMLMHMAIKEPITMHYVLIDFLIYYAVNKYPDIKSDMDLIDVLPGENRGRLAAIMNYPYDEDIYNNITKTDFVFKLSYRTNWNSKTSTGKQTFYGKLIAHED